MRLACHGALAYVQVAGISSLLLDLRSGLKQVRTNILEPAERQQDSMTPAQQEAAASMLAFHRDSRAAFLELEVSSILSMHCPCQCNSSCQKATVVVVYA